jgi:hypothetical protein
LGEGGRGAETPRQFTKQDEALLKIEPTSVPDASFDPYLSNLEKLRNDNLRGLLDGLHGLSG